MRVEVRINTLLLISLIFLTVACKPPTPNTTPVSGIVILDGQPCVRTSVNFIPTGETPGNGGTAQTEDTGKFVVRSHSNTATPGPLGLLPGKYKVVINKLVNPDGTPFIPTEEVSPIDANAKELLHPNYSNFEQAKLTAEVSAASLELKYDLRADGR
jgi:hypothetical protein